MKSISSHDYYISYEQMISLREKGQLNFGIDRLTGQHLTNNHAVLQLADDPALLKATWKAHNFWTYAMLGGFGFTVYLSFTSEWWSFLVGFVCMAILNPILVKSNEENLLDVMIKDKGLYEAMHAAKRLNFLVDETVILDLQKRDDLTETPIIPAIKKAIQKQTVAGSTVDDWDIVGDFGAVMEKADILQAFYDSSELPYPKNQIRDALIRKHNETDNEENMNVFRNGLLALAQFQENIGSTPVRGTVNILGIERSDDLTQMAQQMEEEEQKLDKELFDSLVVIARREYESYKSQLN
ncbi:hypothetical protein OAD37_03745 [Gammaproteobacteria bacterium]|nr:hypothetical protein [Gammaproteobacteria bacterium]